MAGKQKVQQVIVKCDSCGKDIVPKDNEPFATDRVWFNGRNFCHECVISGKVK